MIHKKMNTWVLVTADATSDRSQSCAVARVVPSRALIMAKKDDRARVKSDAPDREPRLLKWVGGITAVLSLVFAVQQAVQLVSDIRERQRQIGELETVAKLQRDSGDYRASWASFEKAIEVAEPSGQLAKLTGQLGDQRRRLREAQEDLAMAWLENVQVRESDGETFSTLIAPLDPVINRGVASSSGARKADLLAHAGWAGFLKWRDGQRRIDPDQQYAQALAIDGPNPYANAYRAHWWLWSKKQAALSDAQALFETALSSGRVKEYVRSIQLASLRNLGSDGGSEYVAVINHMRMKGETVDSQSRSDFYQIYSFACGFRDDPKRLAQLSARVPAADQLATFQSLFFGSNKVQPDENPRPGADACLAVLSEAAGQSKQAMQVWTELAARFPPGSGNTMGDRARNAVGRLQRRSG
jgi:hypothetical protein